MNDAPATTAQTGESQTQNDEISAKIQAAIDANNAAWEARWEANDAKWQAKFDEMLKEKDDQITSFKNQLKLMTELVKLTESDPEEYARRCSILLDFSFSFLTSPAIPCHFAARL